MNPFDQPPATSPVSFDPPPRGPSSRTRMALVALAAAGLVGGGAVVVGELVSAERPTVQTVQTAATPTGSPLAAVGDGDGGDEGDEPPAGDPVPSVDGQIVIDTGDGDPIVIDLGEGTVDGAPFERVLECVPIDVEPVDPERLDELFEGLPVDPERLDELFEGLPLDPETLDLEQWLEGLPIDPETLDLEQWLEGLPLDELPPLELPDGVPDFDVDGTHVTIIGPDGVTVVDLGEGDGSITISQQDGEVSVVTDGDAVVTELPGPGAIDWVPPGGWGDLEPGELPDWLPGDLAGWLDDVRACLAE